MQWSSMSMEIELKAAHFSVACGGETIGNRPDIQQQGIARSITTCWCSKGIIEFSSC